MSQAKNSNLFFSFFFSLFYIKKQKSYSLNNHSTKLPKSLQQFCITGVGGAWPLLQVRLLDYQPVLAYGLIASASGNLLHPSLALLLFFFFFFSPICYMESGTIHLFTFFTLHFKHFLFWDKDENMWLWDNHTFSLFWFYVFFFLFFFTYSV
jgi:hypothetical protein